MPETSKLFHSLYFGPVGVKSLLSMITVRVATGWISHAAGKIRDASWENRVTAGIPWHASLRFHDTPRRALGLPVSLKRKINTNIGMPSSHPKDETGEGSSP